MLYLTFLDQQTFQFQLKVDRMTVIKQPQSLLFETKCLPSKCDSGLVCVLKLQPAVGVC